MFQKGHPGSRLVSVSISALGIATAQGNTTAVCNGGNPRLPASWPWPANRWTTSFICRPATELDPTLTGIHRWQSLLKVALNDCFGSASASETPVFLASCNGAIAGFDQRSWRASFDSSALLADTPWSGARLPVFSSSCNSGMHALYAATQAIATGAKEAFVIAADILSESNQNNFEGLRILAESSVAPWQASTNGFVLGEAAVVLKLTRDAVGDRGAFLSGPVLANSLGRGSGLSEVVSRMQSINPRVVIGQGTGPAARDAQELAMLKPAITSDVPITSPLFHFGHTLGASGLVSIALAALTIRKQHTLAGLAMPLEFATDGRPLAQSGLNGVKSILITSEALDGSCAAVGVSKGEPVHAEHQPYDRSWKRALPSGPLMHPVLRQIAEAALSHRPAEPPGVLLVNLEEPLAPASQAWFGERLLPSAVLEITPGFISQLIARTWGFAGPALCQVGPTSVDDRWTLKDICRERGATMAEVSVVGTGDNREIIWNN